MKQTIYTVIIFHVILFLLLCKMTTPTENKTHSPPPLVIQLHNPPKILAPVPPAQPPICTALPQEQPQPQKKVQNKTPSLSSHATKTTSPTPRSKTSIDQQADSKRKVQKYSPTPKSQPSIPPGTKEKLLALQEKIQKCSLPLIKEPPMGISDEYAEKLVALLEKRLSLPTFGEVELLLTLQKNGTCTKVEVVRSESPLNADLLQTQLQSIQFPPLTQEPLDGKTYTFTLVFYNRNP